MKLWKRRNMRNRPIPANHFERILRVSSPDERALWILSSETGFRIGDLLRIRQWQVPSHSRGAELRLKEAKTGNVRTVKLTERASDALKWSLKLCPELHPFKFLFPSRLTSGTVARTYDRLGSKTLHRSTVYRHFASAVRRAKLDGLGYTVHSLRKMYARRLYEECGSLLAVQRDLGHSSLATTMIYVSDFTL